MKKIIALVILVLVFTVSASASCVFSLSDAECNAGDTVKLSLTLKCTDEGNSFAISHLSYDEKALEFKGFTANEEISELAALPPVFDNEKKVIVIGLSEVVKFDGELCTLEFAVKDGVKSGEYQITANTVAKNFSAVLESSFKAGTVKVSGDDSQSESPETPEEPETPTKPVTPTKPTIPTKPSAPVVVPSETKEWKNPFADVKLSDWFYSAVEYTNKNGIINGISATEFAPTSNVTRAMFVTLLYRLENQPATTACKFTDVKAGSWYEKAVSWANEKGIVQGISESEFAPDNNITREQMATMLRRWAEYKGRVTSAASSLTYADSDKISSWARDSVAWATANGVMSGSGDKFLPLNFATRAEAATVIMRIGK